MNKVIACVDTHATAASVIDWAAWCATRLGAPLELLHALEREGRPGGSIDYSGAIGLGAQEALLTQLSELDAARGQLAQEVGRQVLAAGQQRARAAGMADCDTRLRHGPLLEAALAVAPEARLFVLGTHHGADPLARRHLDHHLERVLREVSRPVLVSAGAPFAPPSSVVLAYDGSSTANAAVARVAQSPLLAGLPLTLVQAGSDTAPQRHALDLAAAPLMAAGFTVRTVLLPGAVEDSLCVHVTQSGASLLVMGAYGHSRIRQLIVGSTTTALLRMSTVPVLVLR